MVYIWANPEPVRAQCDRLNFQHHLWPQKACSLFEKKFKNSNLSDFIRGIPAAGDYVLSF